MKNKLKKYYNSQYTVISVYVVFTALIIYSLALIVTKFRAIFSWIDDVITGGLHIITPIIIGVIIAYLFDPLVEMFANLIKKIKFIKLKSNKKYRSIGVFLTIISVLGIFAFFITFFVYSLTKQISGYSMDGLVNMVSEYINNFTNSLGDVQETLDKWNIESKGIQDFINNLTNGVINWLQGFASNLVEFTMNISGFISNLGFGIIIGIYLLLDKETFLRYGNKFMHAIFSENAERKIKNVWFDFDDIFSNYIRGTMADVVVMSVLLSLVLSIVGIKFAILIGCFAGLCNLIPYFGPFVAYAGTIIFGLLNGQYKEIVIAIILLMVVQWLDGSIIGPKLMGKSISLQPVFILISIIIGGALAGFLGMVIAVPVMGFIKLCVSRYINGRIKRKEKIGIIEDEENADVAD